MQQGRFRAGGVTGDDGWTHHHLGAMLPGCAGDGVVIGAHHHPLHPAAGPCRLDAPSHQRNASHLLEVLAGDSLGSTTGGDQGQSRCIRLLHQNRERRSVGIRRAQSTSHGCG